MQNLYVLGDSFSYGMKLENKNKSWANLLSEKLGYNLKNLSLPGGSNWKICRTIYDLNFDESDLIIIGWTISNRFEFGLSQFNDLGKNAQFYLEDNKKYYFANNQEDIAQPFTDNISQTTCDLRLKYFSELVYEQFYNEQWFDEYFRIFYWSVRNIFERKKCKWIMFDTWCPTLNINTPWKDELKHKNYFYVGNNNMDYFLRTMFKNVHYRDGYWNELGHEKVSDLLLIEYEKNYNN